MKEAKNFKETDNDQIDFSPFGLLHSKTAIIDLIYGNTSINQLFVPTV